MISYAPRLEQNFEYDLKRVRRLIKEDQYSDLKKLINSWPMALYHLKIMGRLKLYERDVYLKYCPDEIRELFN